MNELPRLLSYLLTAVVVVVWVVPLLLILVGALVFGLGAIWRGSVDIWRQGSNPWQRLPAVGFGLFWTFALIFMMLPGSSDS